MLTLSFFPIQMNSILKSFCVLEHLSMISFMLRFENNVTIWLHMKMNSKFLQDISIILCCHTCGYYDLSTKVCYFFNLLFSCTAFYFLSMQLFIDAITNFYSLIITLRMYQQCNRDWHRKWNWKARFKFWTHPLHSLSHLQKAWVHPFRFQLYVK